MTHPVPVTIIGGGTTGLCCAHILRKQLGPHGVVVLEAESRPGGPVYTERIEGYQCDWGPNGFLDKEPRMLEWIRELGLSDDLIQAAPEARKRYLLRGGRLVELSAPPRFLLGPALTAKGKLRLIREPFVPARKDEEPESVWHFAARRLGPEAADRFASAMAIGIFGGDARQLSVEHCFPLLWRLEREHGSLLCAAAKRATGPRGRLTSLRGGIGRLAATAAERLGDIVRMDARVTGIESNAGVWRVLLNGGETVESRAVVITTPAYGAANIVRGVDSELAGALDGIDYAPIAVVCAGYDARQVARKLDGFGYLVPATEGRKVLGCIWTSTVFPESAPAGKVLLRCMVGGGIDPAAARLDDQAMSALIQEEVHPVMGITGEPELLRIVRHERGIPQYGLEHGAILGRIEEGLSRHPGIFLAGNAYHGVGLNDCIVSAAKSAGDAVRYVERLTGGRDA